MGELIENLRQNVQCDVSKINEFEGPPSPPPYTSTGPTSFAVVLQQITGSPKWFVRRRDPDTGTRRGSVMYTLKTAKWGVNTPELLQAVNNNVPNQDCSTTRYDKIFPWRREELSRRNFPGRWIGGR